MTPTGIPTLGQIVEHSENLDFPALVTPPLPQAHQATREWQAAIAAMQNLLRQLLAMSPYPLMGTVLSGPNPVLDDAQFFSQLHVGLFHPQSLADIAAQHFCLPAAQTEVQTCPLQPTQDYPLLRHDPLVEEQFCLILTRSLSLVLVLGRDADGEEKFRFSFAPEVIQQCWQGLNVRLRLSSPQQASRLAAIVAQFPPVTPDYRLITAFMRQMLNALPIDTAPSTSTLIESVPTMPAIALPPHPETDNSEVELLQALTHEIRTPLTTIRLLTRLLLKKRQNFAEDVIHRLERIDQECTEQINRMELIFRATELETQAPTRDRVPLIPVALQQLIEQHIPQWQQQAERRNISLEIVLPAELPVIVSHPALLTQVLTGLMERLTRSLPTGSVVQVQVTTAGNRLKLRLVSQEVALSKSLKSLGQLLMFQPETGSLSLNLDVTKSLFHALGGKLTVRERSPRGEELTIFLPLDSYPISA